MTSQRKSQPDMPVAGTVGTVADAAASAQSPSAQPPPAHPVPEDAQLPPYLRQYEILHLQFADQTHQYLRESIQLADQKAGAIAAGATALLAYLFSHDAVAAWVLPLRLVRIGDIIGLIATAGLALAVLGAMTVIVPRLGGAPKGPVYWQSIARFNSAAAYVETIRGLDDMGLADARLQHCFELARVCTRKYRALNRAIWIGAIGLTAAVVYIMALGGAA